MIPSSSSLSSRRLLLQVAEAGGAINPIIITSASVPVTIPWSSGAAKPFDSSIALTVFILFVAIFFLGFIYFYIKRYIFADDGSADADATAAEEDSKRRGLNASAEVSSLPMVAYGKAGIRRTTIDECTICLYEFDEKETIKIIPYCGHVFHPRCIDTWLAYHVTCPICRSDKVFGSSAEGEEVRLEVAQDRSAAVAVAA